MSIHKDPAFEEEICDPRGSHGWIPEGIPAFALPFPATSPSGRLLL